MVHHVSLHENTVLDDAVRQSRELESLGIQEKQDRTLTAKDKAILQDFHDNYCVEDGRRVVSLPRKKDVRFTSNLPTAERRFQTPEKRLKEDEDFHSIYHRHM
jgi:hypothetical protein